MEVTDLFALWTHHAQTDIAILLRIFVPVVSAVNVTLDLTVSADIATGLTPNVLMVATALVVPWAQIV